MFQPRRKRLEVEYVGDCAVVNFVDKKVLDEKNIQGIGEELFQLIDEMGRKFIIINFGNVEYLSTACLGKFITLQRKTGSAQDKLILCCIDNDIMEVLEITKLNKFFEIVKDEQDALRAMDAR